MPLKSNLNFEKVGLLTFPANNTFLQSLLFKIFIIFPNCPMDALKEFFSFFKIFLYGKIYY